MVEIKTKTIIIALVLSAVAVAPVQSAANDTTIYFPAVFRLTNLDRIQPIGDSITRGFDCGDGWRGMIRQFGFQFVGTIDGVHDGHGGWWTTGNPTGENISDHIESWISAAQPDFVILLVGMNDYLNNRLNVNNIVVILDKINVPVILVGIPNVAPVPDKRITEFNLDLSDLAESRGIQFVDIESRLTPAHMDSGGIHPTCSGYKIMADEIAFAISRR